MLSYIQLVTILLIITVLICASLFSLLETAIVAVSEHKLYHLKSKHRWVNYAIYLKHKIGSVLIFSLFGNSLFNVIFTTLSTIVATDILAKFNIPFGLSIATLLIAFCIIIFSEALPKVIAAKNPLLTIKLIAIPLYYLFLVSLPIIWVIDKAIYYITLLLRVKNMVGTSAEELKSMIADKNSPFSSTHRKILINSINLEDITIKEVLISLRLIEAININDDIDNILNKIYSTHYTQIIVYENRKDHIIGYIHIKDILTENPSLLTKEKLLKLIRQISFVHDFVPIIQQIQNARTYRTRIFVVVNEYGDILGIACLEDMFEIIFGDFTTSSPQRQYLCIKNQNNELIVDGTMLIRELNELHQLDLPINANILTINGLVLDKLNCIPNLGVSFRINNLIFEIIQVGYYWIERVKISSL
jgi:Mg2+/Co2+ transporter CorB